MFRPIMLAREVGLSEVKQFHLSEKRCISDI